LGAAISAGIGRFALAQNWMTSQIDSLVFAQRARPSQVIAIHHDFTEVMREGGDPQRKAIAGPQVKGFCKLIGNRRDARRMWVSVLLKLIRARAEAFENLDRIRMVALGGFK
jgi:hypothetical protein